jgi:iron complex transport system ATP-binding protein
VAWKAIQTMGLEHIAEQSITKISGGERQQVAIARVIAQKPSVILLDEPTSHLDFGNQMKVLKMLRRMADDGYGVVMTTHNPDHVLLLDDQVAVLDQGGKLTFGMGRENMTESCTQGKIPFL